LDSRSGGDGRRRAAGGASDSGHEQLLGWTRSQLVDFDEPEAAAGSIRSLPRPARPTSTDVAQLRAQALNYDIGRLRSQIEDCMVGGRRPHWQ